MVASAARDRGPARRPAAGRRGGHDEDDGDGEPAEPGTPEPTWGGRIGPAGRAPEVRVVEVVALGVELEEGVGVAGGRGGRVGLRGRLVEVGGGGGGGRLRRHRSGRGGDGGEGKGSPSSLGLGFCGSGSGERRGESGEGERREREEEEVRWWRRS